MADAKRLAEKVLSVVPYVLATLPARNDGSPEIPGKPEWKGCHKGRASSSAVQLKSLEDMARSLLAT